MLKLKSLDIEDSVPEAVTQSSQLSQQNLSHEENSEEMSQRQKEQLSNEVSSVKCMEQSLKEVADVQPSGSCIDSNSRMESKTVFGDSFSNLAEEMNLTHDVLLKISKGCKDRLKQILHIANQFRWHCRRQVLTEADFINALKTLGLVDYLDITKNASSSYMDIDESTSYTLQLRRLNSNSSS